MADSGQLVAVLAGPSAAIDRVLPYCDGVRSRATIEMRDVAPGKASLLKVTGNSFILSIVSRAIGGGDVATNGGGGARLKHWPRDTPGPKSLGWGRRPCTAS